MSKSAKMLYVGLLSIWVILTLSACAINQIPDPPEGKLYSIIAKDAKMICSEVPSGNDCPDLLVKDADKFYAMDTKFWMDLENYIDQLVALVKRVSENPVTMSRGGVVVQADDIQKLKDELWFMRRTLDWKRKNLKSE